MVMQGHRLGVLDKAAESSPRLTIDECRRLVCESGRPTSAQIAHFAGYVSIAHSWYKHLPLSQPGVKFSIYCDPGAGRDVRPNMFRNRLTIRESKNNWHHSWMPTEEYRARFSSLKYCICDDASPPSMATVDGFRRLPIEVEKASGVQLTGLVHGVITHTLPQLLKKKPLDGGRLWPGRDDDHSELLELCAGDPWESSASERRRIKALIEPEVVRQRQSIEAAAAEVCRLIFG